MMIELSGGGFLPALLQLSAFYYSVGLLLHFVVPSLIVVMNIQKEPRGKGELMRDALASIGPLCVKAGYWALLEEFHRRGWGKLYSGPIVGSNQWAYVALTLVLHDLLHDTWFYWVHRILHWRPLYRWVHWEHHRSKAPSVFTGYAFNIVEALIVFANELVVPFLFPIHMGVNRFYHYFSTLLHQAGHVGYEISPYIPNIQGLLSVLLVGPKGWNGLSIVQFHDLHHRFPTKHFSLYFTHWDRLCGTMIPGYDQDLYHYYPKSWHDRE